MVNSYVPDTGEIIWMDFDPQAGREQRKRRPALVLTDSKYNRASGLCVVCPITSTRKGYPFEVPALVDKVEGAILADQVKSMDWAARNAELYAKAPAELLRKVRLYLAVLLGIR
ncbi:MAG TPA: endoribonuclease MazF [Nitrospira sp.]|nr:endoribonuclease MazF [Nitrospira sp.]